MLKSELRKSSASSILIRESKEVIFSWWITCSLAVSMGFSECTRKANSEGKRNLTLKIMDPNVMFEVLTELFWELEALCITSTKTSGHVKFSYNFRSVGRGLSKNGKTEKVDLQHWLEAIRDIVMDTFFTSTTLNGYIVKEKNPSSTSWTFEKARKLILSRNVLNQDSSNSASSIFSGSPLVQSKVVDFLRIQRSSELTHKLSPVGQDILSDNSEVVDFVEDSGKVKVILEDGRQFEGDVLVRMNGIWSKTFDVSDKKERLLKQFGSWCSEVVALISETPEDMVLQRVISSWRVEHTTLLGDAGHPMEPNLFQGGCMAIEVIRVDLGPAYNCFFTCYRASRRTVIFPHDSDTKGITTYGYVVAMRAQSKPPGPSVVGEDQYSLPSSPTSSAMPEISGKSSVKWACNIKVLGVPHQESLWTTRLFVSAATRSTVGGSSQVSGSALLYMAQSIFYSGLILNDSNRGLGDGSSISAVAAPQRGSV
ncbi:hypothetical protein Vadar_034512 [Vaccinium darrowii]|uniref:Uncharacterized protein n=1 Tax=Vaccinium darrowii TaxID=229202 RepID=A0ACB7X728_9ERIC|nr:hypothetical protein Vadar_034512 [Vaccinium darrowii]